jgi:hypothetical protein
LVAATIADLPSAREGRLAVRTPPHHDEGPALGRAFWD